MDFGARIIEWIDSVLDYAIGSFFLSLGAFALLKEWRKKPFLAVAAIIVGTIIGYAVGESFGAAAGALAQLFATVGGPALIFWLGDPQTLPRLAEAVLKAKTGAKDTPPKE
jgi:hypothetical protein